MKLAEDMVTRGSLTSSLSHLIQNYLSTPQDYVNNSMNRMDSVSPIVPGHGNDGSPFRGMSDSSIGNADTFTGNGVIPDGVPETWTWESHGTPGPK